METETKKLQNMNRNIKNVDDEKTDGNLEKEKLKINEIKEKEETKKESEKKENVTTKEEAKKKGVQKIKKESAIVNGKNIPISTKYAVEICNFIRHKQIKKAIEDLEEVLSHKKVIKMKKETPHKKGKGIGPGKYPEIATIYFINLLKSLSANAGANNLEEPYVDEAFSNIASRPRARFGKWQRKRTHITLIAKEKTK